MIYTVTFNPAIDYVVRLGEELTDGMTNRSIKEEIYYGGKGINVSRVLKNLGYKSTALGFVAGFTGAEIEDNLKKLGIMTDFITLKNGFSRINVKLKAKKETEINAAGPEISSLDIEQLFLKLELINDGDVLVLAGSIPSSVPQNIYESIMERLQNKKIRIIVDATGELLKNVLKYRPFLIKPNNHELAEIFGVDIKNDDDIVYYARKLREMGAENVLISMAGDGAILVAKEVTKIGVAKGQVINSVGAGDSMVAGFIAGFLKTGDLSVALKYGSAAGSATAFSEGLAEKELVEKIYNKI